MPPHPVTPASRIGARDALRGIALFGTLPINIPHMRGAEGQLTTSAVMPAQAGIHVCSKARRHR